MNTQVVESLLTQANAAWHISDYNKSKELYLQAKELNDSIASTDPTLQQFNEAIINNSLSEISWRTGAYDESTSYAEKAKEAAMKANDLDQEAAALRNIGIVHFYLSEYQNALEIFQKALEIQEKIDNKLGIGHNLGIMASVYAQITNHAKALEFYQRAIVNYEAVNFKNGIASNLGNMGIVFLNLSDYSKALDFFQKALSFNEESGDKQSIAINLLNIGRIYNYLSDYTKALEIYQKALTIDEEIGNKLGIAQNLGNVGNTYVNLTDYSKALEYFEKSLVIFEQIGNKDGIARNLGNIGSTYGKLSDYSKAKDYLSRAEEIDRVSGGLRQLSLWLSLLGEVLFKQDPPDYTTSEEKLLEALAICQSQEMHREESNAHKALAELRRKQERWKEADDHFQKYHDLYAKEQSEETRNQSLNFYNRRQMENAERDRQVKLARFQEQEKILLNILPAQIAERILEGEKRIADMHEHVSVFFSDIVGFTKLSQTISPDELLTMLNEIFSEFDRIARKHGLEKIKTIGDAYMAVAGVPIAQEDHAQRAANFALEVIEYMKDYRKKSNSDLQIRVGLHCGKAIAGVIGENKFAYDLWGDSVNTASRMESHGEAGKIHVSEDFRNALSESNLHFMERGEMEVKGKGKMKTYFLEKES